MRKVLIIDDDEMICQKTSLILRKSDKLDCTVSCALTLSAGLEKASLEKPDAILLDVCLPDGNGLDILPQLQKSDCPPEIIIVTASGSVDGAELAIKSGAWDYLEKRGTESKIILALQRAFEYRREKEKRQSTPSVLKLGDLLANSSRMQSCLDLIGQAAVTDANVLIIGETGTGKELMAKAVHNNSLRKESEFVIVDCASLPDNLAESMLFGHRKGAFTGADKDHQGLIPQANGGTLFLDEIGELSPTHQKIFLRVLQERTCRPLGSKSEITVDFRVISATNRDLSEMEKHGNFRSDLLFRLQTFHVELPPLREREEDIENIALRYAQKFCSRYKLGTKGFSQEFTKALYNYNWPGNVRELVSTMESAVALARHEQTLCIHHLPMHIRVQLIRDSLGESSQPSENSAVIDIPKLSDFRKQILADAEQKYLRDLLEYVKGDIKRACKISGLSRARLYALLKQYQVSRVQ